MKMRAIIAGFAWLIIAIAFTVLVAWLLGGPGP